MTNEPVRLKLDALIQARGLSYAGLSEMLRRNPSYIQQFIRKGSPRKLDEADRRLLAQFFGVDEAELGGGNLAVKTTPSTPSPDKRRTLRPIPRLDIGASAGPGALAEDDRQQGAIGFDDAWLKQLGLSAAQAAHLSLIRVEGDSMLPTLADGDDILVERLDGGLSGGRLREGIYVLRMDDMLIVKRLTLRPGGRLSVTSDNMLYPSYADLGHDAVQIIGRVIWKGGRVR